MAHYVKKPVQVEAFEFTGQMLSEMPDWVRHSGEVTFMYSSGKVEYMEIDKIRWRHGDMIIRGENDRYSPGKDTKEHFLKDHEEVEESDVAMDP